MRILLCTNHDWLGNYILNLFLPVLVPEHEVHVWISHQRWLPKEGAAPALQELDALEYSFPIERFFPLLDALPLNPGAQSWSFQGLTQRYGIPLEKAPAFSSPDSITRLQEIAPDMVLSIRFGGIFREPHIAIPPKGVWNIHSGRLPEYRGVMATFRAMLRGEDAGITLHPIPDASIDTGAPIAMRSLPLQPGASMLWHLKALYPLARDMVMEELLPALCSGKTPPSLPIKGEGTYYSFPNAQEIQAFTTKEWSLYTVKDMVDWMVQY